MDPHTLAPAYERTHTYTVDPRFLYEETIPFVIELILDFLFTPLICLQECWRFHFSQFQFLTVDIIALEIIESYWLRVFFVRGWMRIGRCRRFLCLSVYDYSTFRPLLFTQSTN